MEFDRAHSNPFVQSQLSFYTKIIHQRLALPYLLVRLGGGD